MEQKCIELVNFADELDESLINDSDIQISYNLKYLLAISSSKYATLYAIPTVVKLWTSEDEVDGCTFSDDGSQILAILKTKSLQIFKLKIKDTRIISEANSIQLSAMLGRFGIEFSETSLITPLKFSHQQITLLVDNKWIVGLKWLNLDQLYVTYTMQTATCVVAAASHDRVHLLTSAGNLSGYSLENGKLLGVVNVNSVLRSAGHAETLSAPHQMSISSDGALAAVACQLCAVAVGIGSVFRSAAAEPSNDTASLGSTASWVSTRTVGAGLDPRRRRAPHRATWDAHVKGLRRARTSTADGAVVCAQRSLGSVQSASATAGGVGVWLRENGTPGGVYRVVDARSGALIAEVPLPDNVRVVVGGLVGVADAVVTPAGVAMVLGSIARDKLVRKLLSAMESRSLRYLVRGDDYGAVAVPMAMLNDCLRQRGVDVARLALALNAQALKSALLSTPASEEAAALLQARYDNAVSYMDKMFHSIDLSIQANRDSTRYVAQLTHAALEHLVEAAQLCDISAVPADSLRKSVQAQSARMRGYRRHSSVEEAEDALSEPDPAQQATWLRWREMEAPHVIRLAVSANQLAVAHTYLANSRGWTDAAIDAVVAAELAAWRAQLLAKRDLDGLGNVLANAGVDRVDAMRGIAEETLDAALRDDVFKYLLDRGELTEQAVATWTFLLLLEQVIDVNRVGDKGRLTINSVKNLTSDERSLILHELYFTTHDQRLVEHLQAMIAWRYLLLSNREELLLLWVQSAFGTQPRSNQGLDTSESVMMEGWAVTQSMVDSIEDIVAMESTKEAVLDRLCTFGVFPSRDATDIDAICHRLRHAGLLDSYRSVLNLPTANVNVDQFKMLLTRCVMDRDGPAEASRSLADFAYTRAEVVELTRGHANHWFPLWLTFRALSKRPRDPRCFYKAVLDSCIYFSKGNFEEYLKENPILAIALVVYGNFSIRDVLNGKVPYKKAPSEIIPWEDFPPALDPERVNAPSYLEDPQTPEDLDCFTDSKVPDIPSWSMKPDIPKDSNYKEKPEFLEDSGFQLKPKVPEDSSCLDKPEFTKDSGSPVESEVPEDSSCLDKPEFSKDSGCLDEPEFSKDSGCLDEPEFSKDSGCLDKPELYKDSSCPVEAEVLRAAISEFPLLELSLQPSNGLLNQPDISLVEMLRDSSPFELSHLLRFLEQPDCADLPHFSHPALVAAYGHREHLAFDHYLAHARPMYAIKVLTADHAAIGAALDDRTVSEACALAHGLALQRLGECEVSAACVALTETLGRDSTALRLHLAVGEALKEHLQAHRCEDIDNAVESLLFNLVTGTPARILPSLESALLHGCPNPADLERVVPAMERCRLAVSFARQHGLPLPERFLRLCAGRDLWVPFVLFAQINKYPTNQVMSLSKSFNSPALREHLAHALSNAMHARQADAADNVRLAKRDPRASLYSRIGVKLSAGARSESTESSPPPSLSPPTSMSMSSSIDSIASLERFVAKPDEPPLVTLLRCQRMSDPPRALLSAALVLGNRALAALAACLEPGSTLACLATFVLASLGLESRDRLDALVAPAVEQQAWEAAQVAALLQETVASRDTSTLATAFRVFLPDCPLCPFSEFLDSCVASLNFDDSIMNIKLFKASCLNLKSNPSMLDGADDDGAFLGNGFWVAATAVSLANTALVDGFESAHHQLLLAQTLAEAKFGDHLPVQTPDYAHIAELLSCLSGSGVRLSVRPMCKGDSEQRSAELQRCLDALCADAAFETAHRFARLAGLDPNGAVIARWMHDFTRKDNVGADFWQCCETDLETHAVAPHSAAVFLGQAARAASSQLERYRILQLALGWLRRDPADSRFAPTEAELETETWCCWLALDATERNALAPGARKLLACRRSDLLAASQSLEVITVAPGVTERDAVASAKDSREEVDALLAELMDLGNLAAACKVESLFGRASRDLRIVLTMLEMAEGETSPYDLPTDLRVLLSSPRSRPPSYRRRTHLSVRSNASAGRLEDLAATAGNETEDQDVGDVGAMLDSLSERLEHGAHVGERVALCHRISARLGLHYLDVIMHSAPLDLVRAAGPAVDRFTLTDEVVSAWRLDPDEVSAFVCSELASAVSDEGEPQLWGVAVDVGFRRVLPLCGADPTPLAVGLLREAAKRAAEPRLELRQGVELLIRAHDCFSAACHVEGIAKVLHQARQLFAKLLQHQRWQLMVRMVTGIGRYTEMGYVFSTLKQHEHFEALLVKGMDKVAGLKPALLDFLARRCPNDKDLYRMVALHFSMYEELAEMWLAEAEQKLALIAATSAVAVATGGAPSVPVLAHSAETQSRLASAMSGLANAARHFLRADRLARAGAAARRAELTALQTALLVAVPATQAVHCVLDLDATAVNALVNNTLSFPQAWILTQAYEHHVDWATPLYQHWVVQAETGYLPDFLESVQLTPTLLEDIVKRFQKEGKPSTEMLRQMKELVATCTCIETKYRVASQLGFKDLVDGLLSGWELAYLKDTVWKSGYSNG